MQARSLAIGYDDLNRLVQVARGAPGDVGLPIEDYAYDGEGNRTASHLSSLYASNAHNQLLEDARYTYAYDTRGNRTSRTDKTSGAIESYSYDSQNRLIGYASDTTTAAYAYDALDRRIAKVVDGVTEAFVFDPWNPYRPVANDVVLDFLAGTLTRRWLHGAQVDEPLAFESYTGTVAAGTGTAYDLHADRLGSIISVVDPATGTVTASATYDSFGTRTQSGPMEQRYGFTAREHDTETGLIYYRARHYDPASGRFIQRDPIGFAGGDLNLYAYVGNDPYNWTDPSGLYSSSLEMRNLSRLVVVGSMAAFGEATRACLANPACRIATNNAMQAGVGALADALGIGQPSGASPANGAAQGGLGGLFGAIAGLGQKIGQALDDLGNILRNESEGSEGEGEDRGNDAYAGIEGTTPHPERPRIGPNGANEQRQKSGGQTQAEADFEAATGVRPNGAPASGTGPNGEDMRYGPTSSGGGGEAAGAPTIWINGQKVKIRYVP